MSSHSDDSGHDSAHESDHEPPKKVTRRGMTVKKNIINRASKGLPKLSVEWNIKGQPLGKNGKQLSTFIGTKVRQTVPITIDKWHDKSDRALENVKDELWCLIQKYFDVDESRKDYCMMKAGKLHRKFRTLLKNKWMTDDDGNLMHSPPLIYRDIIKQEDWERFINKRTKDDAFLALCNENRERAKSPDYPYRGGVKGYHNFEEEMLVEEGKDPTQESIDRHLLWLRARVNKDGDIDDPKTKEVAQRIDSISQSVSQGELTDCDGENDILGRALEVKEYTGRVRGLGFGVTPTAFWGSNRHKNQSSSDRKWQQIVLQLMDKVADLEEKVGSRTDEPSPKLDSFRDSCTIASNEGNNNDCELYITNPLKLVARGFICHEPGALLHNIPIPENHVRVRVDVAIVGDAQLPVPVRSVDIITVNDAIGTFVAWPANLINVSRSANGRSRPTSGNVGKERSRPFPSTAGKGDKVSGNVGESQPSPSIAGKTKMSRTIAKGKEIESQHSPSIASMTRESQHNALEFITFLKIYLSNHMSKETIIQSLMDKEIFGEEQMLLLDKEELEVVVKHEKASSSTVRAYIRYLYHEILVPKEQTKRFVFLCPEMTFLLNLPLDPKKMTKEKIKEEKEKMKKNKEEVTASITRRLALARELSCDCLFLAPINLGEHWILLAVDPKRDTIFYLDSLLGHYNNYTKLVGVFNSALVSYWGLSDARTAYRKSSSSTKWIAIKGPEQPNNIDCGYYVMKFMKDVIDHNLLEIPNNYFPGYETGVPFSDEQLIEVKGEWCHHVAGLIHENRNLF